MRWISSCLQIALLGISLLILLPHVVFAELARVRLTDGTVLRGHVELTEEQVLLRNIGGLVQYQRERVARIDWLEPAGNAQSEGMRRLYALAADDVAGHLELAKWLLDNQLPEAARKRCEYVLELQPDHELAKSLIESIPEADSDLDEEQPEDGKYKGVQPPPPLSALDVQRLKLSELRLSGPPERLNVFLHRVRGQRPVEDLVLEQIRDVPDYDPNWVRASNNSFPLGYQDFYRD